MNLPSQDPAHSDYGSDRPAATDVARPYRFSWFDWFCLWYPPGWLILFNRHWQHYHADPEGWCWFEYGLFLIPGGFYIALLSRWLRLGCRSPQRLPTQIEPTYQKAFRDELLSPIMKYYFRAELQHLEQLPTTAPLIVATNHAGMCFPWDLVGLGMLLSQARGWLSRPIAHTIFFDHPWLRWWLPAGWSQVLGGIRADARSFEAAVKAQDSQTILLYAPEGWRGLAKGWGKRYQLQTFDPSFMRLSDRYQVPILPVICMGNESLHPWTINLKKLARWLGLPMFPLSVLSLVFILFPSMGIWANRTRLHYFIQPVEKPWKEDDVQGKPGFDHTITYRQAQALRSRLQTMIHHLIGRR
jgi:1-acyl-sn-glycerol-3-phosphate acyltransferase